MAGKPSAEDRNAARKQAKMYWSGLSDVANEHLSKHDYNALVDALAYANARARLGLGVSDPLPVEATEGLHFSEGV